MRQTMAALNLVKFMSFLLISRLPNAYWSHQLNMKEKIRSQPGLPLPPKCSKIECPSYDLIQTLGKDCEIRRYNFTVWASTTIADNSFKSATKTGFLRLFDYIKGKNEHNQHINFTAPILTQVLADNERFSNWSSFVVSFYVPKADQADPPPAEGVESETWEDTYVAIKRFDGFISDYDLAKEAAVLEASVAGSEWWLYSRSMCSGRSSLGYIVAQYNSPYETQNRVNEIWLTID